MAFGGRGADHIYNGRSGGYLFGDGEVYIRAGSLIRAQAQDLGLLLRTFAALDPTGEDGFVGEHDDVLEVASGFGNILVGGYGSDVITSGDMHDIVIVDILEPVRTPPFGTPPTPVPNLTDLYLNPRWDESWRLASGGLDPDSPVGRKDSVQSRGGAVYALLGPGDDSFFSLVPTREARVVLGEQGTDLIHARVVPEYAANAPPQVVSLAANTVNILVGGEGRDALTAEWGDSVITGGRLNPSTVIDPYGNRFDDRPGAPTGIFADPATIYLGPEFLPNAVWPFTVGAEYGSADRALDTMNVIFGGSGRNVLVGGPWRDVISGGQNQVIEPSRPNLSVVFGDMAAVTSPTYYQNPHILRGRGCERHPQYLQKRPDVSPQLWELRWLATHRLHRRSVQRRRSQPDHRALAVRDALRARSIGYRRVD